MRKEFEAGRNLGGIFNNQNTNQIVKGRVPSVLLKTALILSFANLTDQDRREISIGTINIGR